MRLRDIQKVRSQGEGKDLETHKRLSRHVDMSNDVSSFFTVPFRGAWDWGPPRGPLRPLQARQSAAMALAATWRPRGRLRSVMARTTLGLDMADTFTNSDTYQTDRQTDRQLLTGATSCWVQCLGRKEAPLL